LTNGKEKIRVKLFGKHNMQNLNGAKEVLKKIGISEDQFYQAIPSFEGADLRLELISESTDSAIFKDYAHAPSKVKAATLAVKEQFPERELVACLELHTFSSLTKDFLSQYKGTMKYANTPVVYFNPSTIDHKGLEPINFEDIRQGFNHSNLKVFNDKEELLNFLKDQQWTNKNLLMMSSGTFNKLDYNKLTDIIQ
ncbi:MAG: peptidoglycan synthetase, partial [Fulvivirga sp.]|nr:peptidoglycan synthetase [Fulvivirga sp.]